MTKARLDQMTNISFFSVIDRNVFEMTENNKSFRSERLKI